jgi:hypothetical protein
MDAAFSHLMRIRSLVAGAPAVLLLCASGCGFLTGNNGRENKLQNEPDAQSPATQDAESPSMVDEGRGLDDPLPPPKPPEELPTEICDGLDNDHNGKVDDADVEGDGVCDCLRIATIGFEGTAASSHVVFESWPNERAQNPVTALGNRRLTDALLAPYQVLIVLDVASWEEAASNVQLPANHSFDDDEVAALERWVHAGGGLLATAAYRANEAAEVVNVNRLLKPFGMGFSTTKLDVDGDIEDWTQHAVTVGVSKIFMSNGVEPDGSDALTLARDSAGRVAFQAARTSNAHVLAWGDEWITFEELWQDREDQQVERLWLNMLTWLSPLGSCQRTTVAPTQ